MAYMTLSTWKRKRLFACLLPLMVLPFAALLFWSLGGGKLKAESKPKKAASGLNIDLPVPHLRSERLDKMSFYNQAARDSVKLKELMKLDPYLNGENSSRLEHADIEPEPDHLSQEVSKDKAAPSSSVTASGQSPEVRINRRLADLQEILDQQADRDRQPDISQLAPPVAQLPLADNGSLDRLEGMMHVMSEPQKEDPELKRLDEMLEKILAIQYPEQIKMLRNRIPDETSRTYSVDQVSRKSPVSLLTGQYDRTAPADSTNDGSSKVRFYSFDGDTRDAKENNAFEAVVYETQTLVDGGTVKLRLVDAMRVNDVLIRPGTFIYGMASLNGERLKVDIGSVRYGKNIFPLSLSVFDMDGLEGIHVPGLASRDVAKSSVDRAIQGIGVTSFSPSLEVQAAGAGIEAARGWLGKKARQVRVTVKDGYKVLLYDKRTQPH